jgi:cellulose synthase/poly-beta-1,6-N-acetylglucosamine synthase-like glycosyltransferase
LSHPEPSHTNVVLAAAFIASVVVIWFMVVYQLVLTVAGYLLYGRAAREKQVADRMRVGERPGNDAGPGACSNCPADQWPTVSILIPAHNEAKVIERTVRAMMALDYPRERLEILVVNDGSSDGTAEILDRLAAEDARVHPYHVPPGQGGKGKSRALNLGRQAATGSVFAIYDADNQPEPGALRYLVAELLLHPELGAALGKFRTINKKRNWLTAFINIETLCFQWMLQAGRWRLMRVATLPGTNFVVRREVLDRIGGWDEEALTEDSELSLRIYAAGWFIKFVPHSVTWEQEPERLGVWIRQRTRWVRGNNYVIAKFLRHLPYFKNRWIGFELLYSLSLYYIFLAAIIASDALFVLGAAGVVTLTVPGPYVAVWILAYLLFVVEIGLALSYDREDTPRNWFLAAIMYFTYCQGWIFVVARAFLHDVIQRRPRTWDKTVRVEATPIPD